MTTTQALVPFAGEGPQGVSLEALAVRQRQADGRNWLQLRFRVEAATTLLLPQTSLAPQRRDGLWQHTCLEAFLGPTGQQAYWEFNLSPSGDWNVYRFSTYREGLTPEPFYQSLPLAIRSEQGGGGSSILELSLLCPLPPDLANASALEVGLSAVLESSGSISYWALAHPKAAADFHARDGWRLRL